jgi:hypothetical protein
MLDDKVVGGWRLARKPILRGFVALKVGEREHGVVEVGYVEVVRILLILEKVMLVNNAD